MGDIADMIGKRLEGQRCPECGAPMQLRESRYGLFYSCINYPECRGSHGAHPDGSPLGIPGTQAVKRARIKAHEVFDTLWKNADQMDCYTPEDERARRRIRGAARNRAYRWLASVMEREEVHIGELEEAGCREVVTACCAITDREIREWDKRQKERKC